MQGFPNKVKHLHWYHNGTLLATNSGNFVVIWNFGGAGPAGKEPVVLKGHEANVTALAFQHMGYLLASGDEKGRLFFFNHAKSSHTDACVFVEKEITALCWSPNDKTVAIGTAGGSLYLVQCPEV